MKKIIEEEKREEEEFGVVAGQLNAETGGEIFPPEVEVAPKVEVARLVRGKILMDPPRIFSLKIQAPW